jgi:hypothetical protein
MTVFKNFTAGEINVAQGLVSEVVPITGTIFSGTYPPPALPDSNVVYYTHAMWESVYDFPASSASANQVVDLTFGVNVDGPFGTTTVTGATAGAAIAGSPAYDVNAKQNIYGANASVLVGTNEQNAIRPFDRLGDFGTTDTTNKLVAPFFLNFDRITVKDGFKPGSFAMQLGVGAAYAAPFTSVVSIFDLEQGTTFNGVAGEYRLLYSASLATDTPDPAAAVGLLYKQYGVVVLDLSSSVVTGTLTGSAFFADSSVHGYLHYSASIDSGTINEMCDGLRNRIKNVTFDNRVELNTVYYNCEAKMSEFNYSSNPTFIESDGEIKTKVTAGAATAQVKTFITSVGLYGPTGKLLAIAKYSEPIIKTPDKKITTTVRLDY